MRRPVRYRLLACLLLGALSFVLPVPSAHSQLASQIVPFPTDVHPNDIFYLAGGGFPANRDLDLYLFCQDPWYSVYGHWKWVLPAQHIRSGSFSAWELHTPTPFTQDRVTCTLVSADGDNPYGAIAKLTIWPVDSKLPVPRVPVSVSALARNSSAHTRTLAIKTVPGTRLSVAAYYPRHPRPVLRQVTIPWTGQKQLPLSLPNDIKGGDRIQVMVRGNLGKYQVQAARTKFMAAVDGPGGHPARR